MCNLGIPWIYEQWSESRAPGTVGSRREKRSDYYRLFDRRYNGKGECSLGSFCNSDSCLWPARGAQTLSSGLYELVDAMQYFFSLLGVLLTSLRP